MARRKRLDFITVGGAMWDVSFYTSKGQVFSTPQNLTSQRMLAFEYGAKVPVGEAYFSFGGGASNAAIGLRRLGFRTAIVTCVGKDESGREILENFKREKVETKFIQTTTLNRTGLAFILSQDKKEREHIAFAHRGANHDLQLSSARLSALSADWVYLTSLAGHRWAQNMKNVFQAKKKIGCKIAWNPGGVQLAAGKRALSEYLKKTDILILNKDEAIELALSGIRVGKRSPNFLNRPHYLLNILSDWGPKIIVITLGSKGAWAFDGQKVYKQQAARAKVVDTCGVGDCFGSSFVAGLIATNGNVQKALRWGSINSGSVIGEYGAQHGLLHRKDIINKLR